MTAETKTVRDFFVGVRYCEPVHGIIAVPSTSEKEAQALVEKQLEGRTNIEIIQVMDASGYEPSGVDIKQVQLDMFEDTATTTPEENN